MTEPPSLDITALLNAWSNGDQTALEQLLPLVYAELRRVARLRMRTARKGDILQTTALIHEAYIRLIDVNRVQWRNRAHFYALCARLMRRILVDRARGRCADKRGGEARAIPFGDWLGAVPARDEELLALEEAIQRLGQSHPRKAQVVVLRYFGGLTIEETAEALDTSPETVKRDWKVARLWLADRLAAQPSKGGKPQSGDKGA